jgi:hypothetical protein
MSDYYDDCEPVAVQDEDWRTARKSHRCSACGETVAPGHRYHRTAILFDGRWEATVRCARCESIHAHLSARIGREGADEEFCNATLSCGHEYRERWGEDPPPEISALAFWRPGDPLPSV